MAIVRDYKAVTCPACWGAKGWDRNTGKERARNGNRFPDPDWFRCVLCGGKGQVLLVEGHFG